MFAVLKGQPSNYILSKGTSTRNERVRTWESGKGQPTFAVLHRYGLAADVPSGVLHLTSLVYAHLRDAGMLLGDERKEHLDFVMAIADSLATFAAVTKSCVRSFDKRTCTTYRFDQDEQMHLSDELTAKRNECIKMLLDSFRTNGSWRTRDRSVDRGRRTTKPRTP